MRRQTAYQFFLKHAGYSWDPKIETQIIGRRRCARALAQAERQATDRGFTFEWSEDSEPFECLCDDPTCESHTPHQAYVCLARDEHGTVGASLCGISFGPGVDPWGQPYARVVQAELASEILASR